MTAVNDPVTTLRGARCVRWIAYGVVMVSVGVGAIFGARLGTDPTVVDSPLIGEPAPEVTLPYLEGDGELSLGELRGQVVVVNFWASWGVPCREEHADLLAASGAYRADGCGSSGSSSRTVPNKPPPSSTSSAGATTM